MSDVAKPTRTLEADWWGSGQPADGRRELAATDSRKMPTSAESNTFFIVYGSKYKLHIQMVISKDLKMLVSKVVKNEQPYF